VRIASARSNKEHSRGERPFRASNDVRTASISAAAYFVLKMSNSSARNVASGRWGTSGPDRQGVIGGMAWRSGPCLSGGKAIPIYTPRLVRLSKTALMVKVGG
jgi:hypothetical protein